MQLKDHYKTLGVKPSAPQTEIKKAYRTLAVKYHPDKNPDSALCEVQFKEVNEAYSILSDSRKRAQYDEERWLSGMGQKTTYNEGVTPSWLKKVCVELNTSLAQMDTHRISQGTLQAYMMMILADAHLGILQTENDTTTNRHIVGELLKASDRLEYGRLHDVLSTLHIVAGNDVDAAQMISGYSAERKRQDMRDRMFPFIVLGVTLALCAFMYFYAGM